LAECQRYYQLWRGDSATHNQIGFGNAYTSTAIYPIVYYKQPMRVKPTSVEFNGCRVNDTGSGLNATAIALEQNGVDGGRFVVTVASGGVSYRGYGLEVSIGTSNYFAVSAEL
jgi:hypothetical protein